MYLLLPRRYLFLRYVVDFDFFFYFGFNLLTASFRLKRTVGFFLTNKFHEVSGLTLSLLPAHNGASQSYWWRIRGWGLRSGRCFVGRYFIIIIAIIVVSAVL